MANTSAAKKDIKQNAKRRSINDAKRRALKDATKAARASIKAQDSKAATLVQEAQQAIDKAAQTRVIHPNKAARLVQRLHNALNKNT